MGDVIMSFYQHIRVTYYGSDIYNTIQNMNKMKCKACQSALCHSAKV